MDEVAAASGMNPLAFRRHNTKRTGDTITLGVQGKDVLGNIGTEQCLDAVAQAIGWERWQPPATKSGRLRRGIGLRYSQEHSTTRRSTSTRSSTRPPARSTRNRR